MNHLRILDTPILLGSASPRRKFLLEEAGFTLRIIPANIDETFPEDMSPQAVPEYLAIRKAYALMPFLEPGEVVLAADSVVILNDAVLGKPEDRNSAIQMLQELSAKQHDVITGVCLKNQDKERTFSARSTVTFQELSVDEISYYVDHFKPYDKAGAYGIQEWIGWCKIKEIQGSYSNIMGLPVALVYEKLLEFIVGIY